jgi:hypothetical protein
VKLGEVLERNFAQVGNLVEFRIDESPTGRCRESNPAPLSVEVLVLGYVADGWLERSTRSGFLGHE